MAFAGGLGAEVDIRLLAGMMGIADDEKLFSESPTRWVIEVTPENEAGCGRCSRTCRCRGSGRSGPTRCLRISGLGGVMIEAKIGELKETWQKPLRW